MLIYDLKINSPTAEFIVKSYSTNHLISKYTKYENKFLCDNLCETGCPNYNKKWSCPPYSPKFSEFTKNYKYILVTVLTIEMNQFSYIKNDYLKIKAANTILKSRIDRALRSLIDDKTSYISTGSCRLCKPCKCKLDQPCAHPDLMTYSFESLGINVSDMVKYLFGFELQWYRKGHLPEITSVVAALISNKEIDGNDIYEALKLQK